MTVKWVGRKTMMKKLTKLTKLQPGPWITLLVAAALSVPANAESKLVKHFRYEVGKDASVSVFNQYGPIVVHSSNTKVITVKATLGSERVEIDPLQNGSHVELRSHLLPGSDATNAQVSYELTVPYSTELNLHSATGPLKVEKLGADVTLEGDSASVDVRDIHGSHLHVRTLDGDVTLTGISEEHVRVMTVGGKVYLQGVSGPDVHVETTSGLIRYAGQFGPNGSYELHTYSGNIELMLPLDASADLTAISNAGTVTTDFTVRPKKHPTLPGTSGGMVSGFLGNGAPSVSVRTIVGSVFILKHN